jgi:LPS sulfotransferase NodH
MKADLSFVKQRHEALGNNPFYDALRGRQPSKRYWIAMTPRSGSTFLAHEISALKVLGFPQEFLNEFYLPRLANILPMPSLTDFEDYILHTFTSKQGLFGLKIDWWRFARANELGCYSRLIGKPNCIVYLTRRNFVQQAISLFIATRSGTWQEQDTVFQDGSQYKSVHYDNYQLTESVLNIMVQEFHWQRYLQKVACPVLPIFFEDTISNPIETAMSIAALLEVSQSIGSVAPSKSRTKALNAPIGADWEEKFVRENRPFVEYWKTNRGIVAP